MSKTRNERKRDKAWITFYVAAAIWAVFVAALLVVKAV